MKFEARPSEIIWVFIRRIRDGPGRGEDTKVSLSGTKVRIYWDSCENDVCEKWHYRREFENMRDNPYWSN